MLAGFLKQRKALGIISTMLGVLFVGYQYFDAKWKSRIERALQYTILYQEPDKIAARNAAILWSKPSRTASAIEELDPAYIAKITNVIGKIAEQSIPQSFFSADPHLVEKSREFLVAQTTDRLVDRFVTDFVEGNVATPWPDNRECINQIQSFVRAKLNKIDDHWEETMNAVGEYHTDWGTISKYDQQIWYSGGDGVYYYYTFPKYLLDFFFDSQNKGREVCNQTLKAYEIALSPALLDDLHELKHFYAAVSICTVSGLCDAQVTCEIFNSDVNNFVAKWREYFELWSARENEFDYRRLQAFIEHCFSNPLFLEYSQEKLGWYGKLVLNVEGFSNVW